LFVGGPFFLSRAEKAELEGISRKARPHLREVFHDTFIEVTELGGEAASATSAVPEPFGPAGSVESEARIKRMLFNANHPFVFMVRHQPTGLILFMGRFAGP
jgi:serine protease inhibitor